MNAQSDVPDRVNVNLVPAEVPLKINDPPAAMVVVEPDSKVTVLAVAVEISKL